MQPSLWKPSVELSVQEEQIVKKIRKAKLFVFLRQHRHELFDEAFQQELAHLYRKVERGHPPVAPAMLALALILEAYTGVSDDEVRDRNRDGSPLAIGARLFGHRAGPVQQRDAGGLSLQIDRRTHGPPSHRTDHCTRQPKSGVWATGLTRRIR